MADAWESWASSDFWPDWQLFALVYGICRWVERRIAVAGTREPTRSSSTSYRGGCGHHHVASAPAMTAQ